MKIYIMVDMEGISGICRASQVSRDSSDYSRGQQYMTWDANACIEGCFAGGATEVHMRDAHGTGFNMLWDQIDPRVNLIQGSCRQDRMPGIQGCDGLILLGYHAMAGARDAVLEHTMSSKGWQHFSFNGTRVGEIVIDAAVAATHKVPVIMTSGDDKLCRETRKFLKGVLTAQTKVGLDIEGARLLAKDKAHDLIRRTAKKAVEGCRSIKPFKFKKPITMRLERISRAGTRRSTKGYKVIDARTTEITGTDPEEMLNRL